MDTSVSYGSIRPARAWKTGTRNTETPTESITTINILTRYADALGKKVLVILVKDD
jgi:hypothetical protein